MSQAIVTSRELRNKETRIDLSVPDFHEVPGLLSNDEVFHVIIISSLSYFKTIKHTRNDTVQFMVEKRYGEFEALHKSLTDRFPATLFPELPRKVLMLKDSTPQQRRTSFDALMKFVASNPKVATSSILLSFLGVKPEKIKQVEQKALDDAEAAKSDVIKKDTEAKDETDAPVEKTSPSKYNTQKSVGLFDDVVDEDLDLFQEKNHKDDNLFKGTADKEDGGLFGTSTSSKLHSTQETNSSIFSNESNNDARGSAPALFEASEDTNDDIYLPPGSEDGMIQTDEVLAEEDYSDLLNVDENLDQLLIDTKKPKKPPKPLAKPEVTSPKPKITSPKPSTAPKPATSPKPATAPKPGKAPSRPTVPTAMDSNGGAASESLGDEDIMKYILENENTEEATLDLF